jgi:hypothetical protein
MLQHRGAIFRGAFDTKDVDPTQQSSYYVAFTEVIKILNTKILKYVTLQ